MPTPEKIVKFYQSTKWKKCRAVIRQTYQGVCNDCGNVGREVHHITPLTLDNVDDDNISINPKNLELLCTSCHNAKRITESLVRSDVMFNERGDMIKRNNK